MVLTTGSYMTSTKLASRVVSAYLMKKSSEPTAFRAEDAKSIKEGGELVKLVDANTAKGVNPFEGLTEDDKRRLMAYVVLKRENPVLEEGDNLNYEAAVNSLSRDKYPDIDDLEHRIVEQSGRLEGLFKKPLTINKDGTVAAAGEN